MNYAQIAHEYALDAANPKNKGKYCKWVRLAAKRHLKDLRKAEENPDFPYYFDVEKAEDPCAFIEKLPHIEGEWETSDIKLEPWQLFILTTVFGWRKKKMDTASTTPSTSKLQEKMQKARFQAELRFIACFAREKKGLKLKQQPPRETKPALSLMSQERWSSKRQTSLNTMASDRLPTRYCQRTTATLNQSTRRRPRKTG